MAAEDDAEDDVLFAVEGADVELGTAPPSLTPS